MKNIYVDQKGLKTITLFMCDTCMCVPQMIYLQTYISMNTHFSS